MSVLTESDKVDIRRRGYEWQRTEDLIRTAISGVEHFVKDHLNYTMWVARALELLSDEHFRPHVCYGKGGISTLTELKAAFSGAVQEAWENHKAEWEDPTDAEYLHSRGYNEHEHPWGDGVIALCQWWLNATPYTVWRLAQTMSDFVTDTGHDYMEELLAGEGGEAFAREINKRWDREVDELRKRFEETKG